MSVASAATLRMCGKVYCCETLLSRLPQYFEHMAPELGEFIEAEDAVVGPRPRARHRHLAAADQPHVGHGVVGARHGRVVTTAVRRPVSLATRWMRVVSRASARAISGRIVVKPWPYLWVLAPSGRIWAISW
jgi:hypothetical protein